MKNMKAILSQKRELLLLLAIIPIAIIYMLLLNTKWNPTWDSATYIMLGKSLINGQGFKYMGVPHTKYPFMFPLMLSPIIGLFGRNFFLMQLLIVLMALGSIGFTFWLFRRMFGPAFGFSIMIMTAASFPMMLEATRVLSDIPYMFLSLLALVSIWRYAREEKWSSKFGYISAILILASFFTRYIGLALFAGTVIYLFLESAGSLSVRFKKAALISIIFILPASLWMIRGEVLRRTAPPPSELREFLSYEKELVVVSPDNPHSQIVGLGDIVARTERNAKYYRDLAVDIIWGKDVSSKRLIQVITAILLCGFIYCLIRKRTTIEYYVFFYVLVYIIWTSLQGHRFLVPIIPFIFYYFIKALLLIPNGFISILKRLNQNEVNWHKYQSFSNWIILSILAMSVIYLNYSSDVNTIRNERRKPYYTGTTANFMNAANWVRDNTPPDAVIIADRAPSVHMLTDRMTYTFPWVSNIDEVISSMSKNGTDYIIYTPWGYALSYLSPVLKEKSDNFIKVYESGNCVVYEMVEAKNSDTPE